MDEKEIIFSHHARRKLLERHISEKAVLETIRKPVKLILRDKRFEVYRKYRRLYLKVIFVRAEGRVIIITQYFVKKLP